MALDNNDPLPTFQEKTVPADTRLAGLAALVRTFGVQAPVRRPSAVSGKHIKASRRKEGSWTVFDKRYWPGEEFGDQLGFALRHEDLDLLVLKRLFEAVPPDTVAGFACAGCVEPDLHEVDDQGRWPFPDPRRMTMRVSEGQARLAAPRIFWVKGR